MSDSGVQMHQPISTNEHGIYRTTRGIVLSRLFQRQILENIGRYLKDKDHPHLSRFQKKNGGFHDLSEEDMKSILASYRTNFVVTQAYTKQVFPKMQSAITIAEEDIHTVEKVIREMRAILKQLIDHQKVESHDGIDIMNIELSGGTYGSITKDGIVYSIISRVVEDSQIFNLVKNHNGLLAWISADTDNNPLWCETYNDIKKIGDTFISRAKHDGKFCYVDVLKGEPIGGWFDGDCVSFERVSKTRVLAKVQRDNKWSYIDISTGVAVHPPYDWVRCIGEVDGRLYLIKGTNGENTTRSWVIISETDDGFIESSGFYDYINEEIIRIGNKFFCIAYDIKEGQRFETCIEVISNTIIKSGKNYEHFSFFKLVDRHFLLYSNYDGAFGVINIENGEHLFGGESINGSLSDTMSIGLSKKDNTIYVLYRPTGTNTRRVVNQDGLLIAESIDDSNDNVYSIFDGLVDLYAGEDEK